MRDVAHRAKRRQPEPEPPTTSGSAQIPYLPRWAKHVINDCLTDVTVYLIRSCSSRRRPQTHATSSS